MNNAYISLPHAKLHENKETKNLNNLPSDFDFFFFYRDWLDGIDFSDLTNFQQKVVSETPWEDVKNFLIATSQFGEEIQGEIDLYVTNNRLNEASFRRKLDPIAKNIIRNQNPLELVFQDISTFDAQNPVKSSQNSQNWHRQKRCP